MKPHLLRALPVVVVLACAGPAAAASFNCAKAATPTEKAVCADPKLSALDSEVGRAFNTASEALHIDLSDRTDDYTILYRRQQKDWLVDRDRCVADKVCLRRQYERRLAVLTLRPDPTAPAGVDRYLGLYNAARQQAAGMTIMRNNDPNGVLVAMSASDPAAGRWTCELKGQGSTDEAGDLMVEFEDGSLTFKIVGKELRVAPGEGVAERLAGACGAGGSLAGAYLK